MSIAIGDGGPGVGLAYSGSTPTFLREHLDTLDYVEVPFELLRFDPAVISIATVKPIVLHCASLSIAGTVLPGEQTVAAIKQAVQQTRTPWLGEHLSFIAAERGQAGSHADEYAPGEPYNIGYTVCPPMNEETLDYVLRSVRFCQECFDVPLLVENPPVYFPIPGSTLTQVEFINEICARSSVQLLLDLAHFYITSQTMDFDPCLEIQRLPLERVVEAHISGVDMEAGQHWDNHANRAPPVEFEMLARVLRRAPLRAVTLEYNWSATFPPSVLLEEITRTRRTIEGARVGHP